VRSVSKLKRFIQVTPFAVTHMGDYIRKLHFNRIINDLPTGTFNSILDAGCGGASYALELARKFPRLRVLGVDIQNPDIKNEYPSNFAFQCQNLLDIDDREVYDLIYSIDVLEHISGNATVILNFCKALKPGGYLYIHMPCTVASQGHFLPDRFFQEFSDWEGKEHVGETHTLQELRLTLEQEGLTVIKAKYTFGLLGKLVWELDRATDKNLMAKIMVMPLLKTLARIATRIPAGEGDFLVLARKGACGYQ
jgi:2-polyprenyl-3-methyl-5-hydroxy-6-metoxy-1,4-benzoquinol methylase